MTDVVSLKVPGQPQYVGLVRLAIAGLANHLDFTFDDTEDLKLAVTETCSHLLRGTARSIELCVDFQFSMTVLEIRIKSTAPGSPGSRSLPDRRGEAADGTTPSPWGESLELDTDLDVGLSLVEALMDKLDVETNEDTGTACVTLTRYFPLSGSRAG